MTLQLFIIFYLVVGILSSALTKKLEDFEETPLEERLNDFQAGFVIPLFWFFLLIRDVFFEDFNEYK